MSGENGKIGFETIEKLSRLLKTHRCSMDTDTGYIKYILENTKVSDA